MTSQIAFDPAALAAWMRTRGIDVDAVVSVRRVGKGHSNLTYRLSDESGRTWVVRRPPLGHLLQSAHDVVREARIMAALADTDVPVPAILGVSDDSEVAEVPVVVMEDVRGTVIDEMSVAEALPTGVRRSVGLNAAAALASIHRVDVDAVGLGDLASRSPYAARQIKRWSRQWEASRTRDLPSLDRLTALLERSVPTQRQVSLVHGDFHLRNIIVDTDTGAVLAALDWELSTLGDPLADLGSTLAYWPQAGEDAHGLFAASALDGFATREDLIEAYSARTGSDASDIGFWHVLGLWKIAIIAEGVLRRVLDQPANATAGESIEPGQITGLVDAAQEFAVHYGLV